MPYSQYALRLRPQIDTSWSAVISFMQRMHPSSQVRPTDASQVFRPSDASDEAARFDIGPVVFNIPERADKNAASLFVVVEGWITFGPKRHTDQRPTTIDFQTRVGYFRLKDNVLVHVYGVHYDMDTELHGHPVFHAQLASMQRFLGPIDTQFGISGECDDKAAGLLRNVRTPTAQMDAFSIFTQIGADHLSNDKSAKDVKERFRLLKDACDFFVGAGGGLPYLKCEAAAQCYRSTHWYEGERPPTAIP